MNNIYKYDNVGIIETGLKRYFGDGGFDVLEKSMAYSLFAGGKRIRPVIALEMFKSLGGENVDKVLPFALSIELIHTYSLIHDDLPCMDNDILRRGKPTNHVEFGYANAILAGDGLLNLAFETILNNISDKNSLLCGQVISNASGRRGMVSGQSADLYFEKVKANEEDLNYIHKNKTGALIKASFMVGAIMASANENVLSLVEELGESYGIIFQLTDDLLDKYGKKELLGKSIGKDEENFKSSALHILGEDKTRKLIDKEIDNCKNILNKLQFDKNNFFYQLLIDTICREN